MIFFTMRSRFPAGLGLLEVLISLLLLSVVLLNFQYLQIRSYLSVREIFELHLAIQQIQNLSEELRVNPDRSAVLRGWNRWNAKLLPQGKGFIDGNQASLVWGQTDISQCNSLQIGKSGCIHANL